MEFAAGVERGHDHFQRRLRLELGVRVDRHAAAVVGNGDEAVGTDLDLDPRRVSCDGLVHRVVDDLGEQVMEPFLVGAADVHARPPTDRFQPLQHLDVGGGIGLLCADGAFQRRLPAAFGGAGDRLRLPDLLVNGGEQVVGLAGFLAFCGGHQELVGESDGQSRM